MTDALDSEMVQTATGEQSAPSQLSRLGCEIKFERQTKPDTPLLWDYCSPEESGQVAAGVMESGSYSALADIWTSQVLLNMSKAMWITNSKSSSRGKS